MTDATPEYLAGVEDEAKGLPVYHEVCEERVGSYTTPNQIKEYFDGRKDRSQNGGLLQ